ncbi:MAG: aldo/keto reductase [Pirellulales bacterium]|nr:aldo/keto reductase [Pirellulales bacterium]
MSIHDDFPLNRRRFLEAGSALAVTAATRGAAAAAEGGRAASGMKYRRFGATELKVSEIGLGCASGLRSRQLGPYLFNRYREQLPEIVDKLFDLGGNFVATSQSYHDTEEILGRALKGRRQDAIIFTATGKSEPKDVIAACEQSLKHFQTDCIDCYFAHGGWRDGFHEAALKLKQQGKIRFHGMSCHIPAEHRTRVEAGLVDFVFQPYNYMALAKWTEKIDRDGAEELFQLCKEKDVGVIVMKPMTGHYVPSWAKETSDPKVLRLMQELKQFGTKNLYQAFLMWILKNPNVGCTAIGMNTPQDVIEDCEAVGLEFTQLHHRLLEHYAAAVTGDYCRMCETCVPSCPQGIRIPDILRFRMYYRNYGHREDARELYAALPEHQRATACTACGICQQTCPNGLAIVEKLQQAHGLLA